MVLNNAIFTWWPLKNWFYGFWKFHCSTTIMFISMVNNNLPHRGPWQRLTSDKAATNCKRTPGKAFDPTSYDGRRRYSGRTTPTHSQFPDHQFLQEGEGTRITQAKCVALRFVHTPTCQGGLSEQLLIISCMSSAYTQCLHRERCWIYNRCCPAIKKIMALDVAV